MNAVVRNAGIQAPGLIMAVYRPDFGQGRLSRKVFDPGMTVSQIVAEWDVLPRDFFQRGVVMIQGEHELDRRYWSRTKLKAGNAIVLQAPLAGSKGGSGGNGAKNGVLAIILAVATVLTAGAAAAGFFGAGAGAWFGVGTLSAKLLGAAISLGGALLQSALNKPPGAEKQKSLADAKGSASASGNLLQKGAPVPRVGGTRYNYPSAAIQPLVLREGGDEVAEALFALSGPHKIEDICLGDTPIADADNVFYEVREGWPDDQPISLITRYSTTRGSPFELTGHVVDGDDQTLLKNQDFPAKSLPKFNMTSNAAEADEVHLDLTFPQGLVKSSDSSRLRIAFRVRMRKTSADSWINLPELHFASDDTREIRASIVLKWGDAPEATPGFPASEGWIAGYKNVAGQTTPPTDGWAADASFSAGAGNDAIYKGVEGASNVERVNADRYQATLFLDATAIPRGSYEIAIMRSAAVLAGNFGNSSYQYNGTVRDLFFYQLSGGQAKVVESRQNLSDKVYLMRTSSIVNQHPVKGGAIGPGVALIAIRALNRSIDSLRVKASGYVRDWDGTGWNTWKTTSNPAPHFKDVLDGLLAAEPIDPAIIDNDSLVEWRQRCIDRGYTFDKIMEGDGVVDVLSTIGSCGYAKPRMSETWGVISDYDRSADEPVQIFTSRNSRGITLDKGLPKLPDVIRATFQEASNKDIEREILVWRPDIPHRARPRMESLRLEGISTEAAARTQILFAFRQMIYRSAFWNFEAPAEAAKARRGTLIAVNHSVLDKFQRSARIRGTTIVAGEITEVKLDAPVQIYNELMMEDVVDMTAITDITLVGAQTGISIRDADGDPIAIGRITGATGRRSTLQLDTPIAVEVDAKDGDPLLREGNLAWIYSMSSQARRLVVSNVTYDEELVAQISAVDEASTELFQSEGAP
ncbi:hypothetical protein [Mesorhizobium sp. ES1-1]|uniref:hypothetical protein n=1 Tax=Mesorhizobium sp. ES1-1 TaxID=2876629 RepID=UPI001CCB6DB6|nr:hypothetical protein [Mesorhizobium sp. ES1-1]MBZ9678886.1 hypothetical protein [Mesorhizobium sp. ES1-1]